MDMMQMLFQLKNNPASVLDMYGIPQNIMNNPREIIQFLMNNGNVSQNQYNDAIRQAQNMGIKI